jgi:flagellar motor switch/type III secretory pathway protein FliN
MSVSSRVAVAVACLLLLAVLQQAPGSAQTPSKGGLIEDVAGLKNQVADLRTANAQLLERSGKLEQRLAETVNQLKNTHTLADGDNQKLSKILNGRFLIESALGKEGTNVLDVENARVGSVIRLQPPGVQDNRLWRLKLHSP